MTSLQVDGYCEPASAVWRAMLGLSALLSAPCSSRNAARLYRIAAQRAATRGVSSSAARPATAPHVALANAGEHVELGAPAAYISESNDPYFNLAYEDYLLRATPRDQPVLFMYRNTPCVVFGRNQTPWKETTPRVLRELGIPLIRRRSGGGTVYHDMGNTNTAIIVPRLHFTRALGAELVSKAVRDHLGISQCGVNDRNDVIIRDGEKTLKVSGSAFKIIQHRAYYHGTMLISSDVSALGKSLRSSSPHIQARGVPSVRSEVSTLNTYLPSSRSSQPITHEDFVEAVTREFESAYALRGQSGSAERMQVKVVRQQDVTEPKVLDGMKELKSWEWQYGQTPEFENKLVGELSFGTVEVTLSARHAIMKSIQFALASQPDSSLSPQQKALDQLSELLVGLQYETLEDAEEAMRNQMDDSSSPIALETVEWLRNAM